MSRATEIAWETSLFASPAAVRRPAGDPLRPGAVGAVGADDLVAEARTGYARTSARAAYQDVLHGRVVLVDIRPEAQRRAEGEVHPDLHPVVVERNVLEWRLDPRGEHRLPWVSERSAVVVLCQEGYASSLAAASLARLGLRRVTDVVGGLQAWRDAGLPTG